MICCYNAKSNDPFKESHHPRYTKLHKVDDDQILTIGKDDALRAETEFADLNREDMKSQKPGRKFLVFNETRNH